MLLSSFRAVALYGAFVQHERSGCTRYGEDTKIVELYPILMMLAQSGDEYNTRDFCKGQDGFMSDKNRCIIILQDNRTCDGKKFIWQEKVDC